MALIFEVKVASIDAYMQQTTLMVQQSQLQRPMGANRIYNDWMVGTGGGVGRSYPPSSTVNDKVNDADDDKTTNDDNDDNDDNNFGKAKRHQMKSDISRLQSTMR
jgi:hypothetical protein